VSGESEPDVRALLARHAAEIEALVRHEAGSILAFEEAADLAQGVRERALARAASFEWRGQQAALGWLRTLARSYLSDRREHWNALKRRPAALLRLTLADDGTRPGTPPPASTQTGPATFAERRESLVQAVRALDLLLPRDRELVLLELEGLAPDEIGRRLGLSADSAARARLRALERLRKAWRLLEGR
jgi:RNA polymerase sigma factor (sigma-70 family)